MVVAVASLRSAALATVVALMVSVVPGQADQPASTDEQEMLTKARQEAADRKRAERRLDGTVNIGVPSNMGVPSGSNGAEAKQRETELQRLSEKLRRASELRAMRPPTAPIGGDWKTEVTSVPDITAPKKAYEAESRSALGHREGAGARAIDTHATVLLMMTPGDRGIRRFEKTADPILCTDDGCYISNGSGTSARYVTLRRSFGFINTFGPRAGSCRNQTACVFRGVDVSATNAILQPVDLRVIHHDRRAIKPALIDETCKVDAGRLSCDKPIRGDDFVIWVVPESVATRAGAEALQRAASEGLPDAARRAELGR